MSKYEVRFTAHGVGTATALLDATAAQVTGGYGGWTVTNRERRVGLTQWEGKDPLRMAVPVLFDGIRDNSGGKEIEISKLSRMGLPPKAGGEPPTVTVTGVALPNPGVKEWVIENLQWGTNVMYETVGKSTVRVRQDCVVNLLEYRGDDRVAFKKLVRGTTKKTAGKSKSGWPKHYNVKPGDTLGTIAAHFYHDASKWQKIAKANNLRDPRSLKKNSTIIIPAP